MRMAHGPEAPRHQSEGMAHHLLCVPLLNERKKDVTIRLECDFYTVSNGLHMVWQCVSLLRIFSTLSDVAFFKLYSYATEAPHCSKTPSLHWTTFFCTTFRC